MSPIPPPPPPPPPPLPPGALGGGLKPRLLVVRRRTTPESQENSVVELRRTCPPLELCRRCLAVMRLQFWFRTYVHCQRDENGWPIDPILREGIPPERRIIIPYRTFREIRPSGPNHLQALGLPPLLSYQRMTQVFRFDIGSLWFAIIYGPVHRPLNPLTNTVFDQRTFERILQQALKNKLVSLEAAQGFRERYRYEFERQRAVSRYEVTALNSRRLARQRWFRCCLTTLLEHQYQRCLAFLGGSMAATLQNYGESYLTQTVPNTLGQFQYCQELDLLQLATAMGSTAVVLRLLELGAPLRRRIPCYDSDDAENHGTETIDSENSEEWDYTLDGYVHPLHIALYEGHAHLLPMLMAYEASTDALTLRDLQGLTTIEIAQSRVEDCPALLQNLYQSQDMAGNN